MAEVDVDAAMDTGDAAEVIIVDGEISGDEDEVVVVVVVAAEERMELPPRPRRSKQDSSSAIARSLFLVCDERNEFSSI